MTTHTLNETAPAFVATAHRIVWATVATVAASGEPRTRVLHPIWESGGPAPVDFDPAIIPGWGHRALRAPAST